VLQCVGQNPASRVHELTPRRWKHTPPIRCAQPCARYAHRQYRRSVTGYCAASADDAARAARAAAQTALKGWYSGRCSIQAVNERLPVSASALR
jgi:hypothetical protein